MNKAEEKAWSLLTKQEKDSLFLTLSNGLSSWEAGEIFNLSHYKYLELKERSEKFFKLFSDFFNKFPIESFFINESPVSSTFKDYIDACLEHRLPKNKALLYSGDSSMVVNSISDSSIIDNMNSLKNSKNPLDHLTYSLIMEFDRWNNTRILPKKIQGPSGYKRRQNKRDKVYINFINNISDSKIDALIDIFFYNPRKSLKKCYYLALISKKFDDGYKIIKIKPINENIEKLTKFNLYVFKEYKHAEIFAYLISKYNNTTTVKLGQQFWPEYRSSQQRAINFLDINNLNFYMDDLDKSLMVKTKPKKEVNGIKRASPNIFY